MINKDSLKEFVHLVGLIIHTLQYDTRCTQRHTYLLVLYRRFANRSRDARRVT